jgi:hypothetical protein
VREQQTARCGIAGDRRRLSCGRVSSLPRGFRLVVAEGRFVNQQVGPACELDRAAAGTGVGAVGERASPPRRPDDRAALDQSSVVECDALSALKRSEEPPLRDAEPAGGVEIEFSGPLRLLEPVAEARNGVVESTRFEPVRSDGYRRVRLELDDVDRIDRLDV